MDTDELIQRLREQRLVTLALAEQVGEDRWREPLLPGGSIHDVLAHLLGWDEWAIGVFEMSATRALPQSLVDALADIDGYNARSQKRFRNLLRDDLLVGLETSSPRLIASAMNGGAPGHQLRDWDARRIGELGELWARLSNSPHGPRAPSVKGLLRMLYEHERAHADEISQGFGITADLDKFKPRPGGEPSSGR